MSDTVGFQRTARGPRLWAWLIAVMIVLLIGLVVLLVVWTIVASTFLVDREWWAWNGWAAVAGLAQIAAVIVTLGTLIFLAIQVVMLRAQMREEATQRRLDFERSLSPLVSIQILRKSTTLDGRTLRIACRINADGAGVVYNLLVTLREIPPTSRRPVIVLPKRYLRAPGQHFLWLQWQQDQELLDADPSDRRGNRLMTIEVVYQSLFGRQIGLRHSATLQRESLRITNAPSFFDATGAAMDLRGPGVST